jgi:hypothetical protein
LLQLSVSLSLIWAVGFGTSHSEKSAVIKPLILSKLWAQMTFFCFSDIF